MVDGCIEQLPTIKINNYNLDVVHEFTYLSSIISDILSIDMFARLTSSVWENRNFTMNTEIAVYKAFVISILQYGSET